VHEREEHQSHQRFVADATGGRRATRFPCVM
jgi:hypothetical protein